MERLSIILPTYNEVKSLSFVIESWNEYLNKKEIVHEFVICEDGSTDGTKELVIELQSKYPIVNETTVERRGYGGGVLAGIKAANYEYILCIDSDGQCLPDSFDNFWGSKTSADIVIGIRSPRMDPLLRKIYSGLFLVLHRVLFPSEIKDPSCPYILAKKETYMSLMTYMSYMREGFWWGFVGAALKQKKTFFQYAIKHYERYDGSSVVYKPSKMLGIIFRNIGGLIKLKMAA
jgi:glycosyltransferase involved in cell wall biosynthesis